MVTKNKSHTRQESTNTPERVAVKDIVKFLIGSCTEIREALVLDINQVSLDDVMDQRGIKSAAVRIANRFAAKEGGVNMAIDMLLTPAEGEDSPDSDNLHYAHRAAMDYADSISEETAQKLLIAEVGAGIYSFAKATAGNLLDRDLTEMEILSTFRNYSKAGFHIPQPEIFIETERIESITSPEAMSEIRHLLAS